MSSAAERAARQVLLIAVILVGIGVVMIYSSSSALAGTRFEDSGFFLQRQILRAGLGLIIMFALSRVPLRFCRSLARPLLRLPELQDAARAISLENIVLETDAAPQPFKKYRTNWTEPRHTQEVAQRLAELKGVSVEEVAQVPTRNLTGLLGLDRSTG